MFVYDLPWFSLRTLFTPPLLTRIEVNGPYVTVYGRKDVGSELDPVLKKVNGVVIQGDNFEHTTIHQKSWEELFFDRKANHVHYKLSHKSIPKGLIEYVSAIFNLTPADRKEEHARFLKQIEKDRIKAGHATLPNFVQKIVNAYDSTTPFFLAKTSEQLLGDLERSYDLYCKTPSLERSCELVSMYAIGILKPVSYAFYYDENAKMPEGFDTRTKLVEPLMEIQQLLKTPSAAAFTKIETLAKTVNVAALKALEDRDDNYVSKETPLQMRLDFLSQSIKAYQSTLRYRIHSLTESVLGWLFSFVNKKSP